MNTYYVRLQGIARTKSVVAKDRYEAAEEWARAMPLSTWKDDHGCTIEVADIDGHVTVFRIEASLRFDVRMVPA